MPSLNVLRAWCELYCACAALFHITFSQRILALILKSISVILNKQSKHYFGDDIANLKEKIIINTYKCVVLYCNTMLMFVLFVFSEFGMTLTHGSTNGTVNVFNLTLYAWIRCSPTFCFNTRNIFLTLNSNVQLKDSRTLQSISPHATRQHI